MIGTAEPTIAEDLVVTMEDTLGDLHLEGQTSMASPEAIEEGGGGGVEPDTTMATKVTMDRGQEEEAQAEEGLTKEYPATPMAKGTSSSSSSRHYTKLLSPRVVQPPMGA